ncbi:MAG: class C sortase [Clostridia bacterium]|nr:class C sortase [Clostridia bacterium]
MKLKRISYLIFLIGLSVFMYPYVIKVFFEVQNISELNEYENIVEHMSDEEIKQYMEEYERYNDYIANKLPVQELDDPFVPNTKRTPGTVSVLEQQTNTTKSTPTSGPFGYIDIPKIREKLPIYLGGSLENLAKGVAQLDRTSLPIGGIGTHSVIAGHRRYYSGVRFFKYLDKLEAGDRFYIHVYNMTLTYEVTGTDVILSTEREKLSIDPDKDMVTLLTCEPYRISTHRLLVHAVRVGGEQTLEEDERGKKEEGDRGVLSISYNREMTVNREVQMDMMISYVVVGIGSVLWLITFILFIRTFRKKPKA